MEDGSTGSSGGSQPGLTDITPHNRRQAAVIMLTMAVFLVGLVVLACWAAGNG
jgi:hypothetical protein